MTVVEGRWWRSEPLWAALAVWFRGVFRVGVAGGGAGVNREGGAACKGEGWLAARCASPLKE